MTGRDIRRTGIDKLAVHFIREQVKIILLHHVTNLVHLAAGIQIAGRIIRVTDQNSFCAFVYQLLELLHFRQGEPFLDGSRHRADHGSGRNGKRHIVGIGRFRHNDLISRIQATQKSKQHRFRTSGSDDDIIGRQVDVIFLIITHQFLAIAAVSLAGTIFQNGTVNITNRIKGRSRSRQGGLTDIQVIHMNSSLFCSIGQRCQFANWRCGHLVSSDGYYWHNVIKII